MASSTISRQAVMNLARKARQEANENRIHIQLRNIPRSAIPSDIRRLVVREKLQGVSDVAIDYHRFNSTGRAYIILTSPDHLQSNITALQKSSMSTLPLTTVSSPSPITNLPLRSRGTKGREEAVNRGIIVGNGPHGGLLNPSRNVVMWGFPGKLTTTELRAFLTEVDRTGVDDSRREVVKIDKHPRNFTPFSRHLVRLSSMTEAHRLVRLVHMTYFEEGTWGKKYQIRARVVY